MKNFIEITKKHWIEIILLLVIAAGFYLRSFNFSDWLYFNIDQSRDAKLIQSAFENGPGDLPLLGPRAAGTYLRLGPIFYYEQYLATKIFNSIEPQVLAYPDLFFSILTIPLLFLFSKLFFSRKISLLISTLYTFSFVIIQYSRFAWNPNQIPFWGLLFILSLYKIFRNKEKSGKWLLLLGFIYAIVSQLHFVALVGFPMVAILFWIFYRPSNINWKYWLGSFAIILFFYLPVILSDWQTSGDNIRQFVYALTAKTGSGDLGLFWTIRIIFISFFMFLTSFGHKLATISALGGFLFLFATILSGAYLWKKEKTNRPFVLLIFIWLMVFLFLLIKTDISLEPRFFMPIAAIPFIFWGLIFTVIENFKIKFLTGTAFLSFFVILIMNFNGLKLWHDFLTSQNPKKITRQIFIKQDDGKTLGQLKKSADFMTEKSKKAEKILCFYADAQYRRSYEYIFDIFYPEIKYDRISKSIGDKNNCLYFSMTTANKNNNLISSRYEDYFNFGKNYKFGMIAIWEIEPKENFLNYNKEEDKSRSDYEEKNSEEKEMNEESELEEEEITEEEIITQNEIELDKNSDNKDETKKNESELEKPRRQERIFWKDIIG